MSKWAQLPPTWPPSSGSLNFFYEVYLVNFSQIIVLFSSRISICFFFKVSISLLRFLICSLIIPCVPLIFEYILNSLYIFMKPFYILCCQMQLWATWNHILLGFFAIIGQIFLFICISSKFWLETRHYR